MLSNFAVSEKKSKPGPPPSPSDEMLLLSIGRETSGMLLLSEGKETPAVAVEPDEEKVDDDTMKDLIRNVKSFFSLPIYVGN